MRPPSRRYLVVKRALDIAVSLTALILVAPILIACAMAIRLESPGPVMFSQKRTGRAGRRFPMWKFRTMVANAEELKAELAHLNILPPPDFKIPNDPRITRVGRFLRATSLDELPQLFNVLRGDMSIVGPRPIRPVFFEELVVDIPQYWQRLVVRPGLTGFAQLRMRRATTWSEKLAHDLEYLADRSVRLYLRIVLSTAARLLARMRAEVTHTPLPEG